jgi:phosphopantothenoylcysteine decarboxylase/phosphopantothenate--cysteine ligase
MVCPAMHTEMWEHPAVQDNLATLRRRGVHIVDPESGRLAGGDVGAGGWPARSASSTGPLLTGGPPPHRPTWPGCRWS